MSDRPGGMTLDSSQAIISGLHAARAAERRGVPRPESALAQTTGCPKGPSESGSCANGATNASRWSSRYYAPPRWSERADRDRSGPLRRLSRLAQTIPATGCTSCQTRTSSPRLLGPEGLQGPSRARHRPATDPRARRFRERRLGAEAKPRRRSRGRICPGAAAPRGDVALDIVLLRVADDGNVNGVAWLLGC